MTYELKTSLKTKYNPSVIEYSSAYDLFICGSYHLYDGQSSAGDVNPTIDDTLEQTLRRVNNRFGNLLLISRDNRLVDEYECADGGVFDMQLIPWEGRPDCPVVCHANGFVAVYGIDATNHRLEAITRYETNSSLLTSLTTHYDNHFIVGNSDGQLVFVDISMPKTSQLSVTKSGEPIWTLYCVHICDHYILFVGSDDSRWRTYGLPQPKSDTTTDDMLSQLVPNYINSDADAGITSFASDDCHQNVLSLIVGSYDEFIRYYLIEWTDNRQINVTLKHKLHIDGSGIWRIIKRPDYPNVQLVSGMYSGAHLIVDRKIGQTLRPFQTKSKDSQPNELIYGVNCDLKLNDILMASFYGQTLYLFSKS